MKTMDINEVVSELKEYDGELTVKVWSNGANNAYPISHVGQGHTDGVLDTIEEIVKANLEHSFMMLPRNKIPQSDTNKTED